MEQILIITAQKDTGDIQAVFADSVEKGIEELYARQFDIVILGDDISETEEKKLRKIFSLQKYELLVLRELEHSLELTVMQAGFLLNNYRRAQQGKISVNEINTHDKNAPG